MKWLFGILLVASFGFFVFMQWGRVGGSDSNGQQPQPPLNSEKIKLLPAAILSVSSVQSAVSATSACMEWGDFSGSELTHATEALAALKLGNSLSQRQVEHTIGYWVYIPPMKNSAEVDKSVAQIKKLGLDEYFVVQEAGKWQNAISLGVFKTVEAAHRFRESIKAKGLESAKAGERMSKRNFTLFILKDSNAEIMAKMAALQKDFPDSELKATTCAN